LGDLVSPVITRVKTKGESEYKMAGVKWYGQGVFHRETVRGDQMSARHVTPLVPGALIYNRLFAWKESFAVVPPNFADFYVSSEFPQFVVDRTRILPEYLYLFCTRQATIRAVNAASTGSAAVSRNRFKEDQFLAFVIPLPPLSEQEAVVALWRKAQDEITATQAHIMNLEREVQRRFLSDLGLMVPEQRERPKAFGLWWKDLGRWRLETTL
jgi:type I restriction enzyme S subunit